MVEASRSELRTELCSLLKNAAPPGDYLVITRADTGVHRHT